MDNELSGFSLGLIPSQVPFSPALEFCSSSDYPSLLYYQLSPPNSAYTKSPIKKNYNSTLLTVDPFQLLPHFSAPLYGLHLLKAMMSISLYNTFLPQCSPHHFTKLFFSIHQWLSRYQTLRSILSPHLTWPLSFAIIAHCLLLGTPPNYCCKALFFFLLTASY